VSARVAPTKAKGDLAELKVATDLVSKGYRVAVPFGEDCDNDLIIDRGDKLERVQVKYSTAKAGVIHVQCYSSSLTNGKVKRRKPYTPSTVDWIGVYGPRSDECYYVPAAELGENGRAHISLRVAPTANCQESGVLRRRLPIPRTIPAERAARK
jgi:hypothetical protein